MQYKSRHRNLPYYLPPSSFIVNRVQWTSLLPITVYCWTGYRAESPASIRSISQTYRLGHSPAVRQKPIQITVEVVLEPDSSLSSRILYSSHEIRSRRNYAVGSLHPLAEFLWGLACRPASAATIYGDKRSVTCQHVYNNGQPEGIWRARRLGINPNAVMSLGFLRSPCIASPMLDLWLSVPLLNRGTAWLDYVAEE